MSIILTNGRFWQLGLIGCVVVSGAIACSTTDAIAQITPDQTLGAESSVITPNVNIKGSLGDRIDGGATRGANLFHSFSEFNVSNGGRVYFANPTGIENILTRVTGTNASNILGTLGVNGNANLFLINPNGIIFRENARLDIPGSFFASTASALNLGNGNQFSATNPQAPPLLAINVPIGIQYGTSQPAAIVNRGNLQVGQNLTLAAGNLDLSGQLWAGKNLVLQATDTVKIRDTTTAPFIARSGGNMYIRGNQSIDILALNHPETPFVSAGNLTLVSDGNISGDAHFASGGNFSILNLSGQPGKFVSLHDPIISSATDVVIGDYTGTSLKIEAKGSITTGNITITSPDTFLAGSDPDISILTSQPALILRAGVSKLENPPTISTLFFDDDFEGVNKPEWSSSTRDITPVGNRKFLGQLSGNDAVSLNLNSLPAHNQITVSFDLFIIQTWDGNDSNFGNGPDIWDLSVAGGPTLLHTTFSTQDFPLNTQPGFPQTQTYPSNYNFSNVINNLARTGAAENNTLGYTFYFAPINQHKPVDSVYHFSFTFPDSSSSLQLDFSTPNMITGIGDESWGLDNVKVSNLPIFTSTAYPSTGTITTGNISTFGGSVILSASSDITLNGSVNSMGGDITFNSGGTINTTGGELNSSSDIGGAITLIADGDILPGNIFSSGVKFSGDITLFTNHGNISAVHKTIRSDPHGLSRGGDIYVTSKSLFLSDGAQIITGSTRAGQAGNLTVNASESVELDGTSFDGQTPTVLATSSAGIGVPGDLTINAKNLIISGGAEAITTTAGTANGGKLIANVSESIYLIGSSKDGRIPSGFSTDTIADGNGGDMIINTKKLSIQDGAGASASTTGNGNAGTITVNASDIIEISGVSNIGFSSGLYAQTFASGNARDLTINTRELQITDRGRISVGSGSATDIHLPTGPSSLPNLGFSISPPNAAIGNAGNLQISADKIFLDNQGSIIAQTDSSEGGNINLQVKDYILMRHNSLISATAGTAKSGGNGGNITINSPFIIAVPEENSDITANAFLGNGGNINITTYGIYGLKYRPNLTPRSDITASSQFGVKGTVNINTLGIDPTRGINILSSRTLPAPIDQRCQGKTSKNGNFHITGKGGLSLNSRENVEYNPGWNDLPTNSAASNAIASPKTANYPPNQIVEAQGWEINAQGQVVLTASVSNPIPTTSWFIPSSCESPAKKVE